VRKLRTLLQIILIIIVANVFLAANVYFLVYRSSSKLTVDALAVLLGAFGLITVVAAVWLSRNMKLPSLSITRSTWWGSILIITPVALAALIPLSFHLLVLWPISLIAKVWGEAYWADVGQMGLNAWKMAYFEILCLLIALYARRIRKEE